MIFPVQRLSNSPGQPHGFTNDASDGNPNKGHNSLKKARVAG